MSLDKLPFNWFDFVIVIILLIGVQRGRKRGMSEEMLTMLRWVALVLVCGYYYEPVGRAIADASVFSLLESYVMAYVALALGVAIFFSLIKRAVGGKLVGSDAFGKGEYYLGMPSGVLRVACMLVAALALLSARDFSPGEIKAREKYEKDMYGSDFWPTLHVAQEAVFVQSFTGPYIKKYLGFLLIKPTLSANPEIKRKELPHL
jgi:uncharacterized membrane protein required for colicin V production